MNDTQIGVHRRVRKQIADSLRKQRNKLSHYCQPEVVTPQMLELRNVLAKFHTEKLLPFYGDPSEYIAWKPTVSNWQKIVESNRAFAKSKPHLPNSDDYGGYSFCGYEDHAYEARSEAAQVAATYERELNGWHREYLARS